MRIVIFTFIIYISIALSAQNITIKGKAHSSLIGKEITLNDFTDYINYNRVVESSDTIDAQGFFELKFESKVTKPILLNVENLVGKIYVQPNYVYGIYFPGKDSLTNNQKGTESTVDITIYSQDSTELNSLIIDFNTQYHQLFLRSKDEYLSPTKINNLLDTFIVICRHRYNNINKIYFKSYVEYSIADFFSNTSRSKIMLYKQFFEQKPILYDNYEYMQFFNSYFMGYLKSFASTKNGGNIYNSINAFADYKDLSNQFSSDALIKNDTLRELVLLKGLIDFYFLPDFDKKQVQSVIEQLYHESTFYENKNIANHFLQTIYRLQPGAKAPDFRVETKDGKVVSLYEFNNKQYIYLNFFSTQSESSLKEMKKIVDLKKKFNNKVAFISICLDDSINTYRNYLKNNPKQDWHILYQTKHSNAKQAYFIKSLSGYFFISPQFQLVHSPAPSPSEGIEYKLNALFKPKKRNTIPGIK